MSEWTEQASAQDRAIRRFLREYLDKPRDQENLGRLLADLGGYYEADRIHIFEVDAGRTRVSSVHEWCRAGVASTGTGLQQLPAGELAPWFEAFAREGVFVIRSLAAEYAPDAPAYQLLEPRGIHGLLAVPLMMDGALVGFLSVDNPRRCTGDLLLLTVVASTCCDEFLVKRRLTERMQSTSETLMNQTRIIRSLGEIYTSLYYIDLTTGHFTELSSVDAIHERIGASGDAQERLNYFCRHLMVPGDQEAMLRFVNLGTLRERMAGSWIISRQYRSTLFSAPARGQDVTWRECSFIECDRDADGNLAHVIFTTQSIHETKIRELEAQQRLRETNRELEALLAAEKRHTAIIGSLSSVFFALYYIDLTENTFQELICLDNLRHVLGEKGDARQALRHMTDALVSGAHQSIMRRFTDFDTIDARLGDRPIILQEYEARSGGWTRCSFFPVERDAAGRNRTVLCTLRWVTAEKEELASQDNLIQALAIPYENIYAVREDTREAVCYRMGQAMTDRYGQKFAVGDYEKNIQTYIENDVLREDRPLFDRVRTIRGVDGLLEERKACSFNYRVCRGGETQYFQCQLVKPDPARREFVIGFKNIDEEKRLELAQQRRVEEALAAVEKSNERLMDEMEIANALTKDYPNVFLVELEGDRMLNIKLRGRMLPEEQRGLPQAYGAAWADYIDRFVLEEDRETVRQAVTIAAVGRALGDGDEYACSYRTVREGAVHHTQAVFMRVSTRHTAERQLILGFRNVDAIVEEERRHARIQEEQLRVIDALSREYHSLFKIDAETGAMSLYRTDGIGMDGAQIGQLMALGSYEETLAGYIDRYVVEEDQERMRASGSLRVLLERVPEVGLYKQGYRRRMNGQVSYYEMNAARITDGQGRITIILGMRDVDEEMQRRLKQAREMQAQSEIIEGLASVYYSVLLVDPNRDTVTAYRAEGEDGQAIAEHFRQHGQCWSRGVRSYAGTVVTEDSRQEFLEALSLERIRAGGEDFSLTYEKLTGDDVTYLQVRVAFVREADGSLVAVIGTRSVDSLIRRERQQETALRAAFDAAEAANKAKTDFLSNMSHDIRTPMNGIIGMTAIAAAHLDDRERVQDSLQKITQASKHLLSLINEVLDMSKIESGKVELVEEEFNLSELVDNLLTMTNAQIEAHHHELSVNISGVVHEAVVGDSLRIQKVFTNLMSNAVKYTPDGGRIRLSITERPTSQARVGCYEFVFEDNGIGMSEAFLERIFEPFSRAPDGRVDRIQGTGLGMPISRNIVRMMGGDIKVESQLGVGSRFTVTIYLKLQDTEEVHYDRFIDLDVLVADDDPLSLDSCCGKLNDFGMKAEGVSTGREAVAQVVRHHEQHRDYFACIIDWKMPDMDGIATTRAIRRAVGDEVPIIIISAYDWSDIEQEARAAGANAFISKPLFRSRLARTFSSLVGEEERREAEMPLAELEHMALRGYRALLVEDNELNAEIATEILRMTGLEVDCALDGTEAVDRLAECPDGYYDIIFMDIQMPRMNGYDATRAIRAMPREYCRQVPIVAMTANAFAEDVQSARTVGMNEHIAKPLNLKALARTLNRWLRDC